ncbi:MAG: hypothetical protein AAF921_16530 [Cyanobacteria bacterium P01_D01_bin.44]
MHPYESIPDLDAITRNLIALDLAYVGPKEASIWEAELSALAGLNEIIEICTEACRNPEAAKFWQQVHTSLSDTAALLSSRLAPLLDLNGERVDHHQQLSFDQISEFGATVIEFAQSA